MSRLRGRVVLITGASRGIGRAIAEAVVAEGARAIINYRSSSREAEELVRRLKESGADVLGIRADVSREEDVESMFRVIEENYGELYGIVNNAGHGSAIIWNKGFNELTWGDFEEVI
ncbi:MAG: SDR family NAD(P)-dependent oxidoreductase, partial [Vulcanisaeta sp.]